MRILADECVPAKVIALLRLLDHDVLWIREAAPGLDDQSILEQAQHEQRLLLTFDKDFGELAFRHRLPSMSGIVLFRDLGRPPNELAHRVSAVLNSRTDWAGKFSVVTKDRIRMVILPVIP